MAVKDRYDEMFGTPTKSDLRESMAGAKERDRQAQEAFKEGEREGRRRARSAHPSAGRRSTRRRRAPRPVTTAARQLQAPISRELTSGLRTLGLVLIVIALYLLLENASKVSGFLGGIARGLEWLRSPTATVPRKS